MVTLIVGVFGLAAAQHVAGTWCARPSSRTHQDFSAGMEDRVVELRLSQLLADGGERRPDNASLIADLVTLHAVGSGGVAENLFAGGGAAGQGCELRNGRKQRAILRKKRAGSWRGGDHGGWRRRAG